MNVLDYIVYETECQSGTMREAVGMLRAYDAFASASKANSPINEQLVFTAIELINGITDYRNAPAVFNQGMPAVQHGDTLRRAMRNWFATLDSPTAKPGYSTYFSTNQEVADYFAHEFLKVHPFADGNGRIASLVWNSLNGFLKNPQPMPTFGFN